MSFVDIDKLKVTERLPGWRGRYFHAVNMTVAHYEFTCGASIHEHRHPQEHYSEVLEGELELTVDGVAQVARPGVAAIVPSNARHSVLALTDGRAIMVNYSRRGQSSANPRVTPEGSGIRNHQLVDPARRLRLAGYLVTGDRGLRLQYQLDLQAAVRWVSTSRRTKLRSKAGNRDVANRQRRAVPQGERDTPLRASKPVLSGSQRPTAVGLAG